ncbi:hypothetical protein LCGC14_0779850 [marine sediment metagenome]|uniref:Uncharacterized protein n=1 Tax=marine sediment metagenome TaxID=412755 RepID=A0A0F9QFS0_9ZZZZ
MFPIEILKKDSISEMLNAIYEYNKKILVKIRNDYIYIHQALREYQNIKNKFYKKKPNLANISKELGRYQTVDLELIKKYFSKMEYTLSQFKCLFLFFLIIERIGDPKITLSKIIKNLSLLKDSGNNASVVRHAVIDFTYFFPSKTIKYFLSQSSKKTILLDSILECSEGNIKELLRELGIEDNINSLTIGNRKVFDLGLLLVLFRVKELNTLSTNLAVKIFGSKKIEKIQNFIHHTNLGPDHIIENISESGLEKSKSYFIKAFNLNKSLSGEKLRQEIIRVMRELKIANCEEFYVEPQYGKFLHIAADEDICDSDWEVEIDNFLTENNIKHKKPRAGKFNVYYENSCMYPDWIINEKMVELFGAEHIKGYLEKIEIKKKSNLLPLISISKDDYQRDKGFSILKKEFLS